jgi:hypothetical protein
MEVLVLAVFVRPATPPVQNLASAGMCRHSLALDGAYGRIAAAGLRAELLECCLVVRDEQQERGVELRCVAAEPSTWVHRRTAL